MEPVFERAKLTCGNCGADMYVGLKEFVDVSENPEFKDAIMHGSFFLETCRGCGVTTYVEYPIMYMDPEKHLNIYMAPDHEDDLLEQLNSVEMPDKEHGIYRLVPGSSELLEKILIFDHGRDDRLIELYKVILAEKVREDWPEVTADDLLYYVEPGNEGEPDREFFIVWDEDLAPGSEKLTILLEDELYSRLEEDFVDLLAKEPRNYAQVDYNWVATRMST